MQSVDYLFFNDSGFGRLARKSLVFSSAGYRLLYATRGGLAKSLSEILANGLGCTLSNISDYDFDTLSNEKMVIFVISSDTDALPVPNGLVFYRLLEDLVQDFRVSRDVLSNLRFAVIGVGSIEYGVDNFCLSARKMHEYLIALGASSVSPPLLITDTENLEPQASFCLRTLSNLSTHLEGRYRFAWNTKQLLADSDDEADEDDLEDADGGCGTPDMLSSRQRKQLEKEGYKIVGTHSAVKLCRWTKHHTRGRGGCYKHTFYGISSMNCMEATPSLACANKCVFCWRHHKNPVATSWKWKADPADEIVQEAINLHKNMIKQLRGVPGVTEETHKAALNVKHCALSLVGEPIMYPQINELITELHLKRISTFLVTNAQWPDAIRSLVPVTQLYVSVDAGNREALQKTDRPLFQDFWERFLDSFVAIGEKKQRTVFRLTLVKEYNMGEDESVIDEYVELVRMGKPDFIEIKAVTFCGNNEDDKDNLTMKNVPWHEEVRKFSLALAAKVSDVYTVACEHKHSCSVLIAMNKYKQDNVWHTWIDYEKFADLALSGRTDFTPEEYWAPTPEWAVYGADQEGFDPEQTRHYRNGKGPQELGK